MAAPDKNKKAVVVVGGGVGTYSCGGVPLSLVIVPSEIMLVQFQPNKVTLQEQEPTPEGEIFHQTEYKSSLFPLIAWAASDKTQF